ncbi:alpha/beta hydrolase [Treponema pedis]|uniref:Alpha/beta hydrolase n=1 Tax=Treponema pedis TaxID=409322 RepID=A0A7S6WPI8_9SPIR|nr:alpha/beta hydrolase [Treponema pedis]QOW60392.1 alpha/beta hydrolase [Treponema pedis]
MMKNKKKWCLCILLTLIFILAVLVGYIKFIEYRSLSSWVIEKAFWFMGTKKLSVQIAEAGLTELQRLQKPDKTDNPSELLGMPVTETEIDGMQVFIWNDFYNQNQKIILYIHGGSYINHAVNQHYTAVTTIAKAAGAKVIFPVYPLAPKTTYKTVYRQLNELYKEILKTSSAEKITVIGDSAGGGLALGFALYLRDTQQAQPARLVLFSPWVDVTMTNPEIKNYESTDPMLYGPYLALAGEAWAGGKENIKEPYVSPAYGNFNGIAPIITFTGTHDILYPDILKFHSLLKAQGVEHSVVIAEKMNHAYALYPIPEAKQVQYDIAALIKAQ